MTEERKRLHNAANRAVTAVRALHTVAMQSTAPNATNLQMLSTRVLQLEEWRTAEEQRTAAAAPKRYKQMMLSDKEADLIECIRTITINDGATVSVRAGDALETYKYRFSVQAQ